MDLRQVVRQRVLVPSFAGSNPAGPANLNFKIDLKRSIFLFLHKVCVHRHL